MTLKVNIGEHPTRELLETLLEEARTGGHGNVVIETAHASGDAWRAAGFTEVARVFSISVDDLAARLADRAPAPSFGSLHVQTDDADAVVQAVRQYVPRLPGGSRGSVVAPPRNGWTTVYDELCDREPAMLRRLARELSDRLGAVVLLLGVEHEAVVRFVLFERGRVMDEYASVPDFHGPIAPGDAVALAANPTVVARLTGADAADVRAVVRTAKVVEDLPLPRELVRQVARVLGVQGGEHGYDDARAIPGAIDLPR
ncbi:MAG TPA: hypothetical protein VG079_04455 [Gaiellaceae bacterium]|nr:hypothetical protein [Gaiellaceae bacterium]